MSTVIDRLCDRIMKGHNRASVRARYRQAVSNDAVVYDDDYASLQDARDARLAELAGRRAPLPLDRVGDSPESLGPHEHWCCCDHAPEAVETDRHGFCAACHGKIRD